MIVKHGTVKNFILKKCCNDFCPGILTSLKCQTQFYQVRKISSHMFSEDYTIGGFSLMHIASKRLYVSELW